MAGTGRGAGVGRALLRVGTHTATQVAPAAMNGAVRQILERAITGAGPVKGAAAWGDQLLANREGRIDAAIRDAVAITSSLAGAQGFLTGLGGALTTVVSLPANVLGLATLQVRLAATIAHVHGYDLDDDRVRLAVLVSLLSERELAGQIRTGKLPTNALGLATAPVYDPALFTTVSEVLTGALLSRVGGKRMALAVARRVPVLGGVVGAGVDAAGTWFVATGVRAHLPARRRELPKDSSSPS